MKHLTGFLFSLLCTSFLSAQTPPTIPPKDATMSPYFQVLPAAGSDQATVIDGLPLKSTQVQATVLGVIADVRVTQTYQNLGKVPSDAIYIFPGSTRAAVYAMEMVIGERKLTAKINKREEARAKYETARTEGRTASLLEQQRRMFFK